MDASLIHTTMGLTLLIGGTVLAIPEGDSRSPATLPISDSVAYHKAQSQLCEVAKIASGAALDSLDFGAYRMWQVKIRENCLAAAAP